MQSQPRPLGSGLNVLEPDVAADCSGSGGHTAFPTRHGRWRSNRLGRHILERERGKSLRLGDRAGTGLCGSEMGRPSRSGRLRVAQHQPDGVRLLPGRTRGLRQTFGRLSVIGPRGLQRSLNGVRLPEGGATCRTGRSHLTSGLGSEGRPARAWRGGARP